MAERMPSRLWPKIAERFAMFFFGREARWLLALVT
jgi:hypothetical protein